MAKNICVVGTGYVGLVAAIGLADFGNRVIGVDIDTSKVDRLNNGISPIYENGIRELLERNLASGRLSFTSDTAAAVKASEVVFIAVGTPPLPDGSANLAYVDSVFESVMEHADKDMILVTKSTVPIGTNRRMKDRLEKAELPHRIEVVSNPEFLREGRAINDFFHPDRVIIGCESDYAREVMTEVYRALNLISVPFLWCNLETAELIKYSCNAFLATKIAYINQMANLAEEIGADINKISKSMGMDGRISPKFLHPGPGYGGSCFPKDTSAIVNIGEDYGVDMSIIREVISSNDQQKYRMVEKLKKLVGRPLEGTTAAILGLAFKQETDDIRESASLIMVEELQKLGVQIQAHDPKAMETFSKRYPDIVYGETAYDAMKDADYLILMTEWNEYRSLDLDEAKKLMNGDAILDTRNLIDGRVAIEHGFRYDGVGIGDITDG